MSEMDKVQEKPSQTTKTEVQAKLPKVGVLLVNLGTPDGTSYGPMRRYLAEFLSDRRVIEWPRLIWYPILYGIVLNTRPKRSGKLYDRIWNREKTNPRCGPIPARRAKSLPRRLPTIRTWSWTGQCAMASPPLKA